jgi:hypothetical protein
MKVKNYLIIVLAVLACFGGIARSESEPSEGKGYIGIRMDARPLPGLLVKHLKLAEGQGVRIQNVGVGTPADEAGLERDDIVIALNGKDVTDNREFAEAVQEAGVGTEVTLDIIHLGGRKTVKLKLTSFDKNADFKAKFPPEPEVVQSWQPGRLFHLQPGAQNWIQLDPSGGGVYGGGGMFGAVGGNGMFDSRMNTFFKELYTFHYSTDGHEYTITIEGDPDDDDTVVIVDDGDSHFSKSLKDIDTLPKEYRQAAKEALKSARKTAAQRDIKGPPDRPVLPSEPEMKMWKNLQHGWQPSVQPRMPDLEPRGDMLKRIEKQMRDMQKRIEELEKQRGKTAEHQGDTPKKKKAPHDEATGAHEHSTTDSPFDDGEKI